MKKAIWIVLGIITIFFGWYGYKQLVPPSFCIRSWTPSTKTGTFEFGRASNPIDTTNFTVEGGYGWQLKMHSNEKNIFFDLYKNGTFKKNLKTL
jgi:hypothetical protein